MAKTFQERAKELRAEGLSVDDIVKQLKQEGYKTSRGSAPAKATVQNVFRPGRRGRKTELLQLPIATSRTVALLLVPADKLQEVLEEVYK